MIEGEALKNMTEQFPVCKEIFAIQQLEWDNEAAFQLLLNVREMLPSEVYATCLTILYRTDTDEVQYKTIKEAFWDTKREELMCQADIKKFEEFPEWITIYRGTQDSTETVPRLSWSIKKDVASGFGSAHMFKAVIPKEQVIAYYSTGGDEEEILAIVTSEYEMLY